MRSSNYRSKIQALLDSADIRLGGSRPWDIKIHRPEVFARVLGAGSLGSGESYMDGWWSCEQLDEMFYRIHKANLTTKVTTWRDRLMLAKAVLLNMQRSRRAFKVGRQHYDIGNELYRFMLDKRMIYTCGYWQDAADLDQAQQHKLELVCRKLKLEPNMQVLDIGCGWGGAARYMSQNYQVRVVGVSVSQQQIALANSLSSECDVEFRFQDYRDIRGKFDRIYSLGMFEHVGFKNYRRYFAKVSDCLHDGGLFLLHTIGHRKTIRRVDPWIERYIFPNSMLPSSELICKSSADFLNLEDWHNFGLDYDKTLMAWHANIESSWQKLPQYDQRFRRMWRYYLLSCAGAFRACRNHLWQIVFSKGARSSSYSGVRSAI